MSTTAKPFFLIITDRDAKTFSVHGPMKDDFYWNAAVVEAQKQGRRVNCHAVDNTESAKSSLRRMDSGSFRAGLSSPRWSNSRSYVILPSILLPK
jgi:hypothetical protein